jgi:WD repeat-containing protein 19
MRRLFKVDSGYHGRGKVVFAWQPDGNYLATAGSNGLVHIFGRTGEQVDEISLSAPGRVLDLQWDRDGSCLAVLQDGNSQMPLWELATKRVAMLETNLKDPTFIAWSKTAPLLAVGTAKGNLMLYDRNQQKKIPVLGKNPKSISCGAWSASGKLALGSDDKTLTISNERGDTEEQTELKHPPFDVQWAKLKSDERGASGVDSTCSINMGGRSLLLYDQEDSDNPLELAFQRKYGEIVEYHWYGDGYIMIGFSSGYLVVVSSHMKEIGSELFSAHFHRERLTSLAYSPVTQRAACAGDSGVKIVDMASWQELPDDSFDLRDEVTSMAFTADGQILTIATATGKVHSFLACMPNIHDQHGSRIAYLSSLREISVVDAVQRPPPTRIEVEVEPAFVALGPSHVAVGMNNAVWFHNVDDGSGGGGGGRGGESAAAAGGAVCKQEYLSTVAKVQLNHEHAAVLTRDGTLTLQQIEPGAEQGSGRGSERTIFPEGGVGGASGSERCTDCALTRDFLIYSTSAGCIEFFYLGEWTALDGCKYVHEPGGKGQRVPIKAIYPNSPGTRVIFVDANNEGFLFNPRSQDDVMRIPQFPATCVKVMWDTADWGVFVAVDSAEFATYVYSPLSIHGPEISKLGPLEVGPEGNTTMPPQSTKIPPGHSLIMAHDGLITCQLTNGQPGEIMSSTHRHTDPAGARDGSKQLYESFSQNLALLRLKTAWRVAARLDSRPQWLALSGKAMEQLDIEMAIRVHRQLGDAGMVLGLERIRHIEDKNQLAGHIATLFDDFDKAQELLLASARPRTALEMRRDLLHWEQALSLARTLAPAEVPELSAEYAKTLEFRGEHDAALTMYESAGRGAVESAGGETREVEVSKELEATSTAGIARTLLRLGEVRRGMRLAQQSGDRQLLCDCGVILEGMKQYGEAAALYESCGQHEKAAQIYILSKDLAKAELLMPRVKTPKLHLQFATAKEAQGDFAAAASSYEAGRDLDSVIRLLLDKLSSPERAFSLVRQSRSAQGAQRVARYAQTVGDSRAAIEFLLMARRSDEAFALAQTHNEMGVYAKVLGAEISPEEAVNIARYYEARSEWADAGTFYAAAAQYAKALKLFLNCGESEMDKAIEVVGKARSDVLTHTLIDFLMGESDGVPKDPNFIFRLYVALGNYAQAAKTAIIIARQEQELGNYKVAHSILFETHRELQEQGIRVPQALRRALLLLHSYVLVKKRVRCADHEGAARMLIRVARNISKFPSHHVPILTSTVIECHRAGLKGSAYEYASQLMRAEYRAQVRQQPDDGHARAREQPPCAPQTLPCELRAHHLPPPPPPPLPLPLPLLPPPSLARRPPPRRSSPSSSARSRPSCARAARARTPTSRAASARSPASSSRRPSSCAPRPRRTSRTAW